MQVISLVWLRLRRTGAMRLSVVETKSDEPTLHIQDLEQCITVITLLDEFLQRHLDTRAEGIYRHHRSPPPLTDSNADRCPSLVGYQASARGARKISVALRLASQTYGYDSRHSAHSNPGKVRNLSFHVLRGGYKPDHTQQCYILGHLAMCDGWCRIR